MHAEHGGRHDHGHGDAERNDGRPQHDGNSAEELEERRHPGHENRRRDAHRGKDGAEALWTASELGMAMGGETKTDHQPEGQENPSIQGQSSLQCRDLICEHWSSPPFDVVWRRRAQRLSKGMGSRRRFGYKDCLPMTHKCA